MVFTYLKRVNTTLPLQVEAVKWALNLTLKLEAELFSLESKSKICVNALSSHILGIPWRIKSICTNILVTMSQNPNISTRWIAREANCAANALAKWSSKNNVLGNFDLGNGPPYFVYAIRAKDYVNHL